MDAQTAYELANRRTMSQVRDAIAHYVALGCTCMTHVVADHTIRESVAKALMEDGFQVEELRRGRLFIDWGRP